MSEAKLYLTKVHCPDCVSDLISGVVLKIEGVQEAEFSENDVSLTVTFDGSLASEQAIKAAIQEVGYGFREAVDLPKSKSSWSNWAVTGLVLLILVAFVIWMRAV